MARTVNITVYPNKRLAASVARLMLMAFVGMPEDGQVAHFKDGDPSNMHIDNLEWATRQSIAAEIAPTKREDF